MRPVSARLLGVVTSAHIARCRVRYVEGFPQSLDPPGIELTVIDGNVRMESSAVVRATADVSVVAPWGSILCNGPELFIEYGVEVAGNTIEWVALGYFRVDAVEQEGVNGALRLTCSDRMGLAQDTEIGFPRAIPMGTTHAEIFDSLLYGGTSVSTPPTPGTWLENYAGIFPMTATDTAVISDYDMNAATLGYQLALEDNHLKVLQQLADDKGKRLFFDHRGRLNVVAADVDSTADPVVIVSAGPGGTLVGLRRKFDRDGVYNHVAVTGNQPTEGEPPAAAAINFSSYGIGRLGPMGRLVKRFSSPILTTNEACAAAGQTILNKVTGLPYNLSFEMAPNPALEPLDVVAVRFPAGAAAGNDPARPGMTRALEERHVIDSLTFPLTGGRMQVTTRGVYVDVSAGSGGPVPPPPPPPGGGGGTPPPTGAVPWEPEYADGTAYATITGGFGSEITTSATSGLTGITNGTVVRYTGSPISSSLTITGKSNITLRDIVMTDGVLTLDDCTNVVLENCTLAYELQSSGDANLFLRGATDRVLIDDCLFGPATEDPTPTAFKSRFIKYGDSASAGHGHVTVRNCTFQNKAGPGNPVHTAGDTAASGGNGGVHHVLVTQCLFKNTRPFDENDHETMLMGLSNMQLTNGQVVIEFCRFTNSQSEPEVISMKMNNGRIRGCTFVDHVGSISLRHGDFSKIHDCYMVSDQVANGTRHGAGTRMYGRGHEIHHNTIRVKGGANFERPILIDTGDVAPGTTSNGHANVVDCDVHHNLLVDCESPIVVGDNYNTAPTGSIHDNKIVDCVDAGTTGIKVVGSTSIAGITTSNNQVFGSTGAAGLAQGADGEWLDPSGAAGARTPFITEAMVGRNATWDPWEGS